MTGRPVPGRLVKGRGAAWLQLLRVSALFTVPGDALAGAAVTGCRPNRGTALAVGASLCLYEAGMALNDWADRETDAVERPDRPLPSGRLTPNAALAAATGLTVAGLGLGAAAGRGPACVSAALAATVWAYDLHLKHTRAAPATMSTARALDLTLGALSTVSTATAGGVRVSGAVDAGSPVPAVKGTVPPLSAATASRRTARTGGAEPVVARRPADKGAARHARPRPPGPFPASPRSAGTRATARGVMGAAGLLGAHTYAVTAVSRREAQGGAPLVPLGALATAATVAATVVGRTLTGAAETGPTCSRTASANRTRPRTAAAATAAGAVAAYLGAYARPLVHAALNPSPPLLQRAVGAGIGATIPLQAALAAKASAPRTALALLALVPLARRVSRKVSPT
ncbi:UbiA family prenyltransferase [Streptomyces sp. NPDC054796]